ncbi:M23 family metallopeptidase [Ruegeria marina]|uniref:Peptidase family M23 n=1 Tax=Ruegeria marina TaxID=639004 RepID=A0A1G6QXL6_9RHOB|nr:M23 family metallopeptidase [Ruegeria marina]SDC97078.1 Peptidase family M23 [Ruegeria marina]
MRFGLTALFSLAALPAASDPLLGLPIDCTLGETCYIQQYVDRDASEGARDFACGRLSYDGHKGTDFAVPTLEAMRAGVNVIASAPGVVRGIRDGVEDRVYGPDNAEAVAGRECGNGVVLEHEDGWETQYCHMKQGSVRVRRGDRVERGDVLGQVGISGKAQFPHVHLSVRRDGAVVDPFDTGALAACGQDGHSLWQDTIAYVPGGLIDAGFTDNVPEYEAVQDGTVTAEHLPADAPAIVLFVLAYGGRAGDTLRLTIDGPGGRFLAQDMKLDRDQARLFRATGRRAGSSNWPVGAYNGEITLLREGRELDRIATQVVVK